MVRKRDRYTRLHSKRSRPKTPAPKAGWVIAELSRITSVPVRRIRYYVEHELIRPLELRGTATRYSRIELLRLLAIPHIRTDRIWKLDALKRELERLGETAIEQLVTSKPLSADAAAALGLTRSPPPANLTSAISAGTSDSLEIASSAIECWHHVELLPGLKLLISSTASAAVRSAAKKIYADFATNG